MDVGTFQLKSGTITLLSAGKQIRNWRHFRRPGTLHPETHRSIDTQRDGSPHWQARPPRKTSPKWSFVSPAISTRNSPAAFGPRTETPPKPRRPLEALERQSPPPSRNSGGIHARDLEDETIDNVDADILAAIYNPKHPLFFNAYMHGTPHKDLRFFVRARVGAIPQMDSPEEVALINCNGGEMDDGVWYSEHLLPKFGRTPQIRARISACLPPTATTSKP